MSGAWIDRLREAIEDDGRSLRELSRRAGHFLTVENISTLYRVFVLEAHAKACILPLTTEAQMTANPTFPPIGDAASVKLVFTTATVPPSDDTLDVSDYWSEEMDPENEHWLLVRATFDRTVKWDAFDGGEYAVHRLSGLTVENSENIVFIDREGALSIFGEAQINAFEDEMDTASNWTPDDGSDAAYEDWRDAG